MEISGRSRFSERRIHCCLQVFERGEQFARDTAASIDAVQEFLASHQVTQGSLILPSPRRWMCSA